MQRPQRPVVRLHRLGALAVARQHCLQYRLPAPPARPPPLTVRHAGYKARRRGRGGCPPRALPPKAEAAMDDSGGSDAAAVGRPRWRGNALVAARRCRCSSSSSSSSRRIGQLCVTRYDGCVRSNSLWIHRGILLQIPAGPWYAFQPSQNASLIRDGRCRNAWGAGHAKLMSKRWCASLSRCEWLQH